MPSSHHARRRLLYAVAPAAIVALVAVSLTRVTPEPVAAAATADVPSTAEITAGLAAVAESYPGGWPALVRLFDGGECSGVDSLATAPAVCRSVVDTVVGLGAGKPFPATLPGSGGRAAVHVPPQPSRDPGDAVTPELLADLAAHGAPADLLAGLSQHPPVVPAKYDTLDDFLGDTRPGDVPEPQVVGPTFTSTASEAPSLTETVEPTDSSTAPTSTTATETSTSETSTTDPSTTESSTSETSTSETTTSDTTTSETSSSATSTSETTSSETSTSETSPTEPSPTEPSPTEPTPTTPPPPPPPPLLVAVGDSVTSGHEARPGAVTWWTECDDPGTGPAAPGSSWAGNLRALIGVPWNRYFNYAHSGSSTAAVLTATPFLNPCGVVSQGARPQIGDATAILAANPSRAGDANVAVVTAGINDTNWTGVARQLISAENGIPFGGSPAWATANPGACTDWTMGNPAGNPGAPPGPVLPAWNGVAASAGITAGASSIALSLIGADPGAQVRHLLYYRWLGDPNLPAVCMPAAISATIQVNTWISAGIVAAQIAWALAGGNPNRIQAVCGVAWPNAANIQPRLISFSFTTWALVPGWPHPNAAGRAALANCVNGTLPRAPGGGIA